MSIISQKNYIDYLGQYKGKDISIYQQIISNTWLLQLVIW